MPRNSTVIGKGAGDVISKAPVALVDMDETLCDYTGAVAAALAELRSPSEDISEEERSNPPAYLAARRRLITSAPGFWRNLRPLPLGFQILEALGESGFNIHIITKGPSDQPRAWMEKVEWCRQHVPELPLVIAEDKGLIAGDVLVEDWPPYLANWLRRCTEGLVIVPARPWNSDVESTYPDRCIRYDGTNLDVIRRRLRSIGDLRLPGAWQQSG